MNTCSNGNSCLWVLIIALILGNYGTNVLNSRALSGCGLPILVALLYCMCKNGTLSEIASKFGLGNGNGCGCGCNG